MLSAEQEFPETLILPFPPAPSRLWVLVWKTKASVGLTTESPHNSAPANLGRGALLKSVHPRSLSQLWDINVTPSPEPLSSHNTPLHGANPVGLHTCPSLTMTIIHSQHAGVTLGPIYRGRTSRYNSCRLRPQQRHFLSSPS